MPELPEVENLRRGLDRALRGRRILRVAVRKPKIVSGRGNIRAASASKARAFERNLAGESILQVRRTAKNLVFELRSGALVVAHLKMSGQFAFAPRDDRRPALLGGHPIRISETELPNKHTHIVFELDKGTLYYNDPRMFGYVLWYPDAAAAHSAHFGTMGVEPLDPAFTLRYFREALRRSRARLKAVLMGQSVVTGLGNIYADEACFAAGVLPDRVASSLTPDEVRRLHRAIKRILLRAIAAGGSSVASYRLLDLTRGNYARELKVYDRAGNPCKKCGRPLSKTLIQARTTVFCAHCQR